MQVPKTAGGVGTAIGVGVRHQKRRLSAIKQGYMQGKAPTRILVFRHLSSPSLPTLAPVLMPTSALALMLMLMLALALAAGQTARELV